jgi:hypothetical protein
MDGSKKYSITNLLHKFSRWKVNEDNIVASNTTVIMAASTCSIQVINIVPSLDILYCIFTPLLFENNSPSSCLNNY